MKNRLFIFGNGFDIVHQKDGQLNTNYSNFRQWLISKCPHFNEDLAYDFDLPDYFTNYRRLESYNESEYAEFFVRLVDDADNTICEDDEWQHFEDTLGILNWGYILLNVNEEYDEDGDVDPWKTETNYSSVAQQAGESNHILCDMFRNWIIEVNSDLFKITKKDLLDKLNLSNNDLFLNFNYTSTLEKVYGISNVCHIHGWAEKYEQLVVGHGRDRYEASYDDPTKDEAFSIFEQIFNKYKKKPMDNINKHMSFFSKINKVDEIYILGVSFGDADQEYFKYIFSKLIHLNYIYMFIRIMST